MQEYINQIIHGDCLDIMARLPDESVDMIFTDPPYGHGNHDGDLQSGRVGVRGARQAAPAPILNDQPEQMRCVVSGMLQHAARILRRDCCCCCCCCGGGPSPTFAWLAQRMDEGGLDFFHAVVWDKSARGDGLGWRYRRNYEMVMVAHRTGGRLRWADEAVTQRNIIAAAPPRERVHPNEKPLDLVMRFIKLHTLPGDIVLDPFAGSSTTAIACMKIGRRFICIEKDAQYVTVGKRRVEDAAAQTNLFGTGAQNTMEGFCTSANSRSTQLRLDIVE